jgi:hypothetical protein
MKSKKLLLLVSVAVVAILVIVLNEQLSNKKPSEKSLKFFNDKAGSFVVKDASGSVTVHKKGESWVVSRGISRGNQSAAQPVGTQSSSTVTDFATDSAAVAMALEKIDMMKKEVLISENQDKQAIFEVDTAKGTFLEVFDTKGTSLGSVYIGKDGPDWNSNYVRSKGSNKVYTVSGGIRMSFFSDMTRWRDKLMLSFDKTTAKNLSLVKKDGSTITLAKADTGTSWNITAPVQEQAKTDQIETILNTLARFNAVDFQDLALSDSATGFAKPELTILTGLSNGNKKITFGTKRTDNKCYVKIEGKETVYLINDTDFNNLNKDLNSFKIEAPKEAPKPAAPVSARVKASPVKTK